jgi:large subunit ribosomal protein L25
METITLSVQPRQETGKGQAGRLRRNGKVPGVFYGPGKAAAPLLVDAQEFRTKLAGLEGSHLIQLTSPLPELHGKLALLKEVQRHPVTSELLHLDFYEVDVAKPIQITVPLHFVGKAEGVTAGGTLQPLFREITVECLPREIPEFVEVDVSSLKIHDAFHLEDLALPPGVKAVYDTNVSLVTVLAPVVTVEAKPAEAEAEAAAPAAAPAASAAPAGGEKK